MDREPSQPPPGRRDSATACDELLAFMQRRYPAGCEHFESLGRLLLNHAAPGLERELGRGAERFCREPLLFSHGMARGSEPELRQIAFGALLPSRRPAALAVRTDNCGRVRLPGLGALATAVPDAELRLAWNKADDSYRLSREGRAVSGRMEKLRRLHGGIDVDFGPHPVFSRLWPGASEAAGPPLGVPLASYGAALGRAWRLIATVFPAYWRMIAAVTRRVVLLENVAVNSFASNAAFGAVFLNITEHGADEVFFIEDLVHQCGHVLFNAATHDVGDYLAVAPDAVLPHDPGDGSESRTVYGALHGLFTEAVMNACFERCVAAGLFAGRQAHELMGRYALIYRRFNYDLIALRQPALYTTQGAQIYDHCRRVFEEIYRGRGDALLGHDYSGQPYSFNYRIYRANNPPARRQPARRAAIA